MNGDLCRPGCCPVCQARFRGASRCSRCGADLSVLMSLASQAFVLRSAARELLRQADYRAAAASVQAAQQLHATPEGNLLTWICLASPGNAIPE
jgi:predicted amidophosphoribosyltransferase